MALRARTSGGNSAWRMGSQLRAFPSCSAWGLSPASWFCSSPRDWRRKRLLKHGRRTELLSLTWGWCAQGGLALGFLHSSLGDAGLFSQPAQGTRHLLGLSQGPAEPLEYGAICQNLPSRVTQRQQRAATRRIGWWFFSNHICKAPIMSRDKPLRSAKLLMN